MKHQSGIVLISVLCILSLMTFITLASFEYSRLQLTMAHSMLRHLQMQNNLLFQLKKIEDQFQLDYDLCNVPTDKLNNYPEKPTAWWLNHACLITEQPFHTVYINETISQDVCGLIIHRITVKVLQKEATLTLQTTEIEPTKYTKACKRFIKLQHYGRQGLRWI
jgi:hypothetical protein